MIDKRKQIQINRFIQNMPPLPISVTKILEITKNPTTTAKELNNVISLDPVLTGKVLKLINSAYYALPNQITSIVRAIIMLGINTVKNLALSTAVISTLKVANNFNALNTDAFWRHSICVGAMAKYFAKKSGINIKSLEEYFVGGLLHDIGKIPFNAIIPEDYIKAITRSRQEKKSLHIIETEMFGINHCDLGYRIAELWKLNPNLSNVIRYHHNFNEVDEINQKFVALTELADLITTKSEIGFSGNSCPKDREEEIFAITKLSWDDVDEAENNAEDAIKKAKIFLQIS